MEGKSTSYLLHRLVAGLDRAADVLLRDHINITYNRYLFLFVARELGTCSQHDIAVALGYSDPAVSVMLLELAKDGLVSLAPDPEHGRKRRVTLTSAGADIVSQGRQLLDERFDQLLVDAGVDGQLYRELTERIALALGAKTDKGLA